MLTSGSAIASTPHSNASPKPITTHNHISEPTYDFSATLYADAKLVGKEGCVEKALAFTEVHAADSSGNGAADGNGTDIARLVFRDCNDSGCVKELVRYWVEGVGCQVVEGLGFCNVAQVDYPMRFDFYIRQKAVN